MPRFNQKKNIELTVYTCIYNENRWSINPLGRYRDCSKLSQTDWSFEIYLFDTKLAPI